MFYRIAVTLARFVYFFIYRIKTVGKENAIESGGVIYAANHKSWADPIIIALTSKRQLTFMSKKELFKFRTYGYLLRSLGAFPFPPPTSWSKAWPPATREWQAG